MMNYFTLKIRFDINHDYDNPMYVLLDDEASSVGRVDFSTFRNQLEGKFSLNTSVNENMFVYPLLNDKGEKFYYAIQLTSTRKPNTDPSTIKELMR